MIEILITIFTFIFLICYSINSSFQWCWSSTDNDVGIFEKRNCHFYVLLYGPACLSLDVLPTAFRLLYTPDYFVFGNSLESLKRNLFISLSVKKKLAKIAFPDPKSLLNQI